MLCANIHSFFPARRKGPGKWAGGLTWPILTFLGELILATESQATDSRRNAGEPLNSHGNLSLARGRPLTPVTRGKMEQFHSFDLPECWPLFVCLFAGSRYWNGREGFTVSAFRDHRRQGSRCGSHRQGEPGWIVYRQAMSWRRPLKSGGSGQVGRVRRRQGHRGGFDAGLTIPRRGHRSTTRFRELRRRRLSLFLGHQSLAESSNGGLA